MASASPSRCRSVASRRRGALDLRRLQHRQREHDHRLVGQAQAAQRLAGADAALQRRTQKVCSESALDVGAGTDAQHVQRHHAGAVAQRLHPVGVERLAHRGPDRAEHLVAGAHGDRDPGHGELVPPDAGGSTNTGSSLR
jgi:hypothetical protein